MSFVGILVPNNISNLLSQIDVPGEKSSADELHITLMYFEKLSNQDTIKAIDAIQSVVAETTPFNVQTNTVSHFPGWEDNDKCAVIAKIQSKDLHAFRQKLAEAFDQQGVEFSKVYKGYKPHITLSYSKEEPDDFEFPKVDFTVSEIILWCGEEMNDKLLVKFPFSLEKKSLLQCAEQFYRLATGSHFGFNTQTALRELGLSHHPGAKELKKRMQELAFKHHPDRMKGDDKKFRRALDAYHFLKDQSPTIQSENPNSWQHLESFFSKYDLDATPEPPPDTRTQVQIEQDKTAPAPGMGKMPSPDQVEALRRKYENNPKPWGDWSNQ